MLQNEAQKYPSLLPIQGCLLALNISNFGAVILSKISHLSPIEITIQITENAPLKRSPKENAELDLALSFDFDYTPNQLPANSQAYTALYIRLSQQLNVRFETGVRRCLILSVCRSSCSQRSSGH